MSGTYVLAILTGVILTTALSIFRSAALVVRFEKSYFVSLIAVTMSASILGVLLSQVPKNCNL
jgi:hypothetical protein